MKDIGYIMKEGGEFQVQKKNVDNEIKNIEGKKIVVKVMNERYEIKEENERWGQIYDEIYGKEEI